GNGDVRDFTSNPTATVSYSTSGRYSVRLEVMSKLGVVDRKIITLDISDLSARIIDPNKGKGIINTDTVFDGSASRSDRGGIRSYRWEITPSDGQRKPQDLNIKPMEGSTMSKLTYKFTYPLKYNITLTVTDQNGNSSSDTLMDFEVTSQKPVAVFTTEIKNENKPATVSFDAEKSFDPDGDKKFLTYKWTVHTTTDKYRFINDTSETSTNPVIQFFQKGKYEVTLRVSDTLTSGQNEEYGEMSKTVDIESVLDLEWGTQTQVSEMINEDGYAEISFEMLSSNAVAYEIDFDDGDRESGSFNQSKLITHRYTESGDYKVKATVFNIEEEDTSITKTVYIGDGNTPIAKISVYIDEEQVYDLEEAVPATKKTQIRFDASESKNVDGTGRMLNYSWDFGDTTRSSQKSVIHTFNELSPQDPGYYTVRLTVSDKENSNISATDEVKIDIDNLSPKFSSLQGIPRTERGANTTPITVLMKVYGAEDPDGRITQYRWWYYDIDDPDNELGSMITTVDNAQMTIGTNGPEGEEIEYGLGVELTDNDNLTYSSKELYDTNTVPKVKVVNGPNALPVAKFSVNATKVFLGDPITFTSTSTDPDGNIVAYIWDLEGDGFFNNAPTDKPTIEYTYDAKNLKGFDVRLKVRDDKGGEAVSPIVKIYVDAKSNPPEADFEFNFPDKNNKLKVQFVDKSKADTEVNAKIAQTLWDFDLNKDTSGDMIRNNDVDARVSGPLWTYDTYGIYKVKLQVVDSLGERSEITKDVVIGEVSSIYDPEDTTVTEDDEENVIDLLPVKAVLEMTPATLSGESGIIKLDFSKSEGPIKYYQIDKNINFDSAPTNGVKDDDFDYITDKPGTWQTNFQKSWGEIVVKLTVIREDGQSDSITKKIIFQ
ncbi:MAG: PKD domain-containing protein, partial [Candidatus Gracilibacteria bacterium]|nr:PKD domain-containing protein [Candidatus Gracilibacteria bacterium]